MPEEWFGSWFDSPYYQLLYKHRDTVEASRFLEALLLYIRLPRGATVLDLACGRGRHSVFLQQAGFDVTGLDYSSSSIRDARISAQGRDNIRFVVHDMRMPFPGGNYHAIFNLFTSFGYFDQPEENHLVLRNVHDALQPNGWFIMDYLNPNYVSRHLVASSRHDADGIRFNISRRIESGRVIKDIEILDGDIRQHFQENVGLFGHAELSGMLLTAGFRIDTCWGDYGGQAYSEDSSPRMIFICRKDIQP